MKQITWKPHCTLFGLAFLAAASTAIAQEETHNFNIATQRVNDALKSLANATHIQIFSDGEALKDKQTQGVKGTYTTREALRKLLAGTGLTYTFTADDAVAVKAAQTGSDAASTLPIVKVTGTAVADDDAREEGPGRGYVVRNSDIGTKMNIPLMELPQAAQVITKQVIQDQGSTTINDVLKNVAGYAPANTFGEAIGEFKMRGFDVGPLRDGEPTTYGYGANARDLMNNFERIEVLKGPAAVAYGASQFGDLGGIINLVSKMPLATARYQFSSQTDQYGYETPSFDATGPLNDSKTVLYRITGQSLHRGSFIKNYQQDSWAINPSITFTNNRCTDLTLKFEYSQRRASYYGGLPFYGTLTGPNFNYPISRSYEQPGSPAPTEPNLVSTAIFNHKFNDDWSVKTVFRFFDAEQKWAGATYDSWNGRGGVDNLMNISQDWTFYHEKDRDFMGDVQLHGNASILGTENKLLFGVQHLNYQGDTDLGQVQNFNSINLLNPQYGAAIPTNVPLYPHYKDFSHYTGIYFQDQLALTSKLKFLLGTRYNIISDTIVTDINNPSANYKNSVNEPTPSIGVTYAITDSVNLYSSYNRGVKPTFGTFAPGTNPQPEQSRQYEIGAKFDNQQGLTGTLAFFDIVKQHDTVGLPGTNYSIQVGEVRSEGIEANAIWAVPDTGWTITGTYGYTDAKVTQNTDPTYLGGHLPLVPHNSARFWSMYRFPENSMLSGFRVGGGMFAVDGRQATLPNSYLLPGYASFDALLGYAFKHYDVALNFQNLADHRIYETANNTNGGVFMGAPFTAVLSLRTTW